MKKKNLADKIAEKAFNNPKVQESWNNLLQVFGPILEPAFTDDPKTRIHLGNALNSINRGDLKKGVKLLEDIRDNCKTDADNACWLFCMGLVFDMAGQTEAMVQYYTASCEYEHNFHMPYLKLARQAHNDLAFDAAEYYYKKALYCFANSDTTEHEVNIPVVASTYTNLASALIMMHRYEEAEGFLELSEQTLPDQPGRSATFAILYASMDMPDEAFDALHDLESEVPGIAEEIENTINQILNNEHPQNNELPIDQDKITSFWNWFSENKGNIITMIRTEMYEEIYSSLNDRLREVFPFVTGTFEFGFGGNDGFMEITFADFYSVALRCGYEKLIADCPQALKEKWRFYIDR